MRIVLLALFVGSSSFACGGPAPAKTGGENVETASTSATTSTATPSTPPPVEPQLEKIDLKVGAGAEAKSGDAVTVDYVGTLTDGSKFDSSIDRKQPFSFILGSGKVIKGWELGVVGMKVGGKRKLVVPPELGYGDAGQPPSIPPRATLIFEIELLHVVQ